MITCSSCGHEFEAGAEATRRVQCPTCNAMVETAKVGNTGNLVPKPKVEERSQIAGIILTYLKTKEHILLSGDSRFIIGRLHLGSDAMRSICDENGEPVISRKHCVIEIVNDQVLVRDCGSTNGTFVGSDKVPCGEKEGRSIEDGGIVFLGKERFQIKFQRKIIPAVALNSEDSSAHLKTSKTYLCRNCQDFAGSEPSFVCPKCNAKNDYRD